MKHEKDGDLRKDARLMELNRTVNRLLMEDPEGISRSLRVRTYAVVCLDEECGLLEWVNHTQSLRHCIAESLAITGKTLPRLQELLAPYNDMQKSYGLDIEKLVECYKTLVLDKHKPCLHQWFLMTFQDATKWLEAREAFSRSVAVWAVVGHIVGLGDRHAENILLDSVNGDGVFVDFDCIFDKGLNLSVPEIVPFRLTPNIVDAFGVMGIEGIFRQSMEVSLRILRENKESLLSILEPFLYDPTVAWSRRGRAQMNSTTNKASRGNLDNSNNTDAKEALTRIRERLEGVYNIHHPKFNSFMKRYEELKKPLPSKGLCAHRGEDFRLSVQGQVQRLVEEAIAEENLAQMYIGWQPWL